MAMLGKIEELVPLVQPNSRLRRGLELLEGCVVGHFPEIMNKVASLAPGESSRIPIEGDALYLLLQCYKPRTREQGRFEAHERHADLQFLWSGRECIEVCDLRTALPSAAFDAKGNVYFPLGNETHQRLLLQAGQLAVLLPGEAHAACLRLEGEAEELVRKIVVKVMDAHLPDSTVNERAMEAAAVQSALPVLRN